MASIASTAPTSAAGADASGSPPGPTGSATPSGTDQPTCTPLRDLPGGDLVSERDGAPGAFPWDRPDPVVLEGFDDTEIIPGGPPPDGIEPIDEPCFDDVASADAWLADDSPVMVLDHRDTIRVYPLAIMTQHEIVNDVVAGDPVVVTYCPLCNSGLAFRRTVDESVLDFGTSGRLFQSNLVMYDRQTRSLWTQFDGRAVMGADHVGTTLERLATSHLGWGDVRATAPNALVLSPDTNPTRDYGRNPYPGYEDSGDGFLFQGPRDDRIGPNTRVVGLGGASAPVAITLPHLRERRVVDLDVEGTPVTAWWSPGQASALDAPEVDDGRDVGSTAVFDRRLPDGTEVAIRAGDDGAWVDEATGSRFDLLGRAIDGPLAGTTLEAVAHDDTFWFVWFAFRPATTTVPAIPD